MDWMIDGFVYRKVRREEIFQTRTYYSIHTDRGVVTRWSPSRPSRALTVDFPSETETRARRRARVRGAVRADGRGYYFFAFVAVDRSFVAVGTRARWCESRDVMSSCDAHNVACVNTDVADGEVLSAFAAYVGVALVVLTAFGCVRAHVPIYTGRCHLRSLKTSGCAPRERRARGVGGAREKCGEVFGWIVHVLAVSDSELVETAGLDALVFLRISQFGTQLFAPLA